MAELTHFYAEDNTKTTSTDSGWVTALSISAASLTANTKYLIIARCLTFSTSTSAIRSARVLTADDSSIESKSRQTIEHMQTGSDDGLGYFFVHSYTTDASPADVELQWPTDGGGHQLDQMSLFLLDLDAITNDPIGTYYFDATDAGPTDSGSDWTNDANAFDGSDATEATTTDIGSQALSGDGTTAPTSGATIGAVTFRLTFGDNGGANQFSPWLNVAPPSGGWTWQKVNDLSVEFFYSDINAVITVNEDSTGGARLLDWFGGLVSTRLDIREAEVRVYGADGLGYFEGITAVDGGTDLSATEATTILAEIAGSDMGTDEHLILGYGRWDNGNNGKYGEVTLYTALDASSQAEVAYSRHEGEDTQEQHVVGFAARHQASSGTPNATIYGETASGGGGQHQDGGGYIIALPTSLFADSVFEYTAAATSGLDGTETTIESSGSYTPTTTGNHLIFGHAHGSGTPTALGGMWVESTTTEIRTGDSTPTHNQMWDTGKDDEMMATFQRYGITTAETLNLRAQGAGSDFEVADRWLIVVNLNEVSGDTPGSASPGVIARSFTVDAVTPVGPAVDVQDLTARSFTVDAPAVHGAAVDVQDAIARSFAMGAPTLVGPAVDVQGLINRSFALDAVTTSNTDGAPGSASPAATVRAFTVDAATPVGAGVDVQDLIARSFALGAPTQTGAAVDVQDLIARAFALGAPTLVGPGVQVASLINRSFALDQVAPAAPFTVTPAVIARAFALGTPTTAGAGRATPAAIARTLALGAVTPVGPAVDVQDLIALSFALDQVTPVPGGTTVAVAAIARAFALGGVTLVGGGVQTAPLIARVFALDLVTLAAPRTVTPGVIARAFTVDAVTTAGAAVDVPDLIARSFVLDGVTPAGAAVDVQDLIARVFVLDPVTTSNTDSGAGTASPAAIVRAFALGVPTLVGGAVDVQALIARAFALGAATPRGAAVDVQDLIARAFALGAPTLAGAGVDVQDVIARSFALGGVTLVGPGGQAAPLIARSFGLGAANGSGAAVVLPAAIARAFTVPGVTLVGGGIELAPVIARSFALGAATGAGAGLVLPGAITLAFTVDAVTTAGDGVVSAPTVVLVLTLPLVGTANSDAALLVAIVEASVIGRTRVLVVGRTRGQVTQQDRGTIRDRSRGRIDDRDRVT